MQEPFVRYWHMGFEVHVARVGRRPQRWPHLLRSGSHWHSTLLMQELWSEYAAAHVMVQPSTSLYWHRGVDAHTVAAVVFPASNATRPQLSWHWPAAVFHMQFTSLLQLGCWE